MLLRKFCPYRCSCRLNFQKVLASSCSQETLSAGYLWYFLQPLASPTCQIIAFQNCLQERRAQACFGKLTIVYSQIFIVAIFSLDFYHCGLFNLFQSSNVRFDDIPNVRSSRMATGRRRRGTRSTSNDSNSVTRA